jgi:molecular chaperone DnaK
VVYDLGGGTFDTSLMRAKDGRMSVVDHDGDNFLGGKDFDWKLVSFVVEELKKGFALADLARGNPVPARARPPQGRCEDAKIELSRRERTTLCRPRAVPGRRRRHRGRGPDAHPRRVRVAHPGPPSRRTVELCRRLLSRHGLAAGSLEKLIFVGGPTLTPLVRGAVEDALGVKAELR